MSDFTVAEAPARCRRGQPFGNYDFSKASKAVLAVNGLGDGLILWTVGGHFAVMYEQTQSLDAAENGLDYIIEAGIWIWEGVYRDLTTDGVNGIDYDCRLDGELREPTEAEWEAIKAGKSPWDDQDYKLKEKT